MATYAGFHESFDIGAIFKNIASSFNKAINNIANEIFTKQLDNISADIYKLKADIENFRNYIEEYYINDIESDEERLKDYFIFFSEMKDKIDELIENKEYANLPFPYSKIILKSLNELYDELSILEFDLSYKVAEKYSDNKSSQDLLPSI